MKFVCICLYFVVFHLINLIESAKILGVFPTPAISHQVVFHAFVKDLAQRGHELTVLTTDLMEIDNPNVTQINLHDSYEVFQSEINFVALKESNGDEEALIAVFMPVLLKVVDKQLSHPDVRNIIEKKNNQTFDLVIIEHLYYMPIVAFAEIYDCPIIGITSLDALSIAHNDFGNEANPVIHPDVLFTFSHGHLTFYQRWKSLKYYLRQYFNPLHKYHTVQVLKHFPTVNVPIEIMKNRIQLIMTNAHPAMGYVRPILPNTIQLGFMHIEPPKPLKDVELKKFLDNSKNGVIYMSLGTNVNSKDLAPELLTIFLQVFGSLPYNVIWKFEADQLVNKPKNVMISKWLQQSDLLAHPSMKLFITQGGQQSMEEAIDRTVPMIVIPFIGDQDANAKRMEEKGIGYRLKLDTLKKEKLDEAIMEMLKPKYKENVRKLRELINDQPMTSREKAVWWTEFVIRHKGAKHLEYPGRLVPFYQRYWLDFIFIMIFFVIIVIALVMAVLKKCFTIFKLKNE